ncbi:MAG: hypothetical protein GTN67_04905 [Hydrotalea flava]|jgi:hypothetical protein|uniref:hypothetical protein n=1 Tax=Hydrotalea sp. TaxID=2881279 RepID=UPI0016BD314A|nr:hypothetical protein [Hydrotalea sp.]NIM34777.1 hypothetical protein [Hydrotalea flava]NIM37613.1 hypothetical protein [Hydrotalea flava]NIN02773.1 hypothetical protein [Hydrotalea flava]NIN14458.1 hypothetical protein [Hydrotalea flava]NIO93539.1 hypothetical protein [Hydrotalea flava]
MIHVKKTIWIWGISLFLTSCGLFSHANRNGCPSNGKNVDAGKLAAGDPKAMKAARKAPKFKADKNVSGY